jgi:hypothetical protein
LPRSDLLTASRSVVFDANGRGSIALGPEKARENWHVTRITVQATGAAVPQARVYRGAESPSSFIDGTETGNLDVSETDLRLYPSDYVTTVWTGGSVGGIGSVVIEGTRSYGVS